MRRPSSYSHSQEEGGVNEQWGQLVSRVRGPGQPCSQTGSGRAWPGAPTRTPTSSRYSGPELFQGRSSMFYEKFLSI